MKKRKTTRNKSERKEKKKEKRKKGLRQSLPLPIRDIEPGL